MTIRFDSSELAIAEANLLECDTEWGLLEWKYETSNANKVDYIGYLPSPFDGEAMRLIISIPTTAGTAGSITEHTYVNASFSLFKNPNVIFKLPEPDPVTRSGFVSITEIISYVKSIFANL